MIVIAQTLLVFFAALIKFRFAIFLFFTFIAFSPRSLGLLLGGAELSITFARVTFPLLLVFYVISKIVSRPRSNVTTRNLLNEKVFAIIFVMGGYKVITTLINGISPFYALENLLFSAGSFALFYFISNYKVFRATSYAIVFSCSVIAFMVIIEMAIETPLHFFIANPVLFQEDLLILKMTDRGYRAQAIFDNSLSLAEYLLYALPVVLFWRTLQRGKIRLLLTWVLAGMIFSGVMTGSRGFLLFGALTLIAYWLFLNWFRFSKASKALIIFPLLSIFLFSMAGAGFVLSQLIEQSAGVKFVEVDSAVQRSNFSRALQFKEVFTSVSERPFVGYGVLQNFSNDLEEIHRIDNYYLRSALEAGVLGFALFFMFFIVTFREMFHDHINIESKEGRAFFAMALSLLVAFAGAKVFLSMPTNNFIFFALLGSILGLKKRYEKSFSNAHSPRP